MGFGGMGLGKKFKDIVRDFFVNDIPPRYRTGIFYPHKYCIVIAEKSIIGTGCIIYNNVTLASKYKDGIGEFPLIGNNVTIFPNSVIIGGVTIGDNCIVGAGSIVTKSFPDNCVIVGNPAKRIR